MKIGLYISELLQDHDYVILPGVGAFFSNYRPALVDEEMSIVHPPSREITFSPELKNNDGLLLNHMAHREGLTAPVAHGLLENLKDELHYRLDHGEPILLEYLGTLSREGGSFRFVSETGTESFPGAYGMNSIPLRKFEIPADLQIQATPGIKTSSHVPPVWKSSGRKKHLLWFLIIPVAGLVVFTWFRFRQAEPITSDATTEMAVQARIPEPVIHQEDSVRADSLQVNPQSQLPEITHPATGMYYVIGGSFKDRENADKYCRQAISKGYEPKYLGEIGNFHVVAIGHYTTESEAVSHQNRILRQDSTAGTWIYLHSQKED